MEFRYTYLKMSCLYVRTNMTPAFGSGHRCCVLIGQNGHGKTALKNRLCGTSHLSQPGVSSITRNLYLNPVSVGMGAFSIIDAPGIGSSVEVFKHALLNYTALTTYEINTVFVVVKYENRYDTICTHVDKALGLFDNDVKTLEEYGNNIVVLLSHFDQATSPAEEFGSICRHLIQFNVFNVVAYSIQQDPEQLANALFACVSNSRPIKIDMAWELFLANFPFNYRSELREIRRTFDVSNNVITSILTFLVACIESEIDSISQEDRDEWLQAVIVTHRHMCEEALEEFKAKHQAIMEDLDFYACYIELQQKIMKQEARLVAEVKNHMTYDINDSTNPKNRIKKCPECGIFWWKVAGCDGETRCGNREWGNGESESEIVSRRSFFRFVFFWADTNKTRIAYRKQGESDDRQSAKRPRLEPSSEARPQGCGAVFTWEELPALNEQEWAEILKITTIEAIRKTIEQDMGDQIREYKQAIDTSFKQ